MDIRKTVTLIEDTLIDGGQQLEHPVRRVATIAVVRNPLVARDDSDLNELSRDGEDLGRYLAQRALEYIDRARITAIGKGVIVGLDGEPEHGQAILYPRFTAAARDTLGLGATRALGEKRLAAASTPLAIPLYAAPAATAEQPTGSLEIRVPGSPRPDEFLVALVVAGQAK
jgi:hypothetical protein